MRTTLFFPLVLVLFCSGLPLYGQQAVAGLFLPSPHEQEWAERLSWEELHRKNETLSSKGYELIDLETKKNKEGRFYWAVWEKTGRAAIVERLEGWEALTHEKRVKAEAGLMLTEVESYLEQNGQRYFIGVWTTGEAETKIWVLDAWTKVLQSHDLLSAKYFFLSDVEALENQDGSLHFLILFQKGNVETRTFPVAAKNKEAFDTDQLQRYKSGFRISDLEVVELDEYTLYLAVYQKGKYESSLSTDLDWTSLLAQRDFLGSGFQLGDLEVLNGTGSPTPPPSDIRRLADLPNLPVTAITEGIKAVSFLPADHSAPAAFSNGLVWLARNGFPKIAGPDTASWQHVQKRMAMQLADGNHTKTLTGKHDEHSLIDGLVQFLTEKECAIRRIDFYTVRKFEKKDLSSEIAKSHLNVAAELDHPPLDKAHQSFMNQSVAFVEWGIYEPVPNSTHYRKIGSCWSTLAGYGVNEFGVPKANALILHDPGSSSKPRFIEADEFDRRIRYTDETLLQTGSPDDSLSPKGRLIFQKVLPAESSQFVLWESLLVLEL